MQKIQATLVKNQVSSASKEAHFLFEKSKFGEKQGQKIIYSLSEAFFLLEKEKLQIKDTKENILTKNIILRKFHKIDKDFQTKYTTFKDLREKGYIVKTALKFGATFRVYEKGKSPNTSHSKWLCYPIQENQTIKWQEFAAKNRVAHSSKKNLLLAIIDEENQISYYEIKWTQP